MSDYDIETGNILHKPKRIYDIKTIPTLYDGITFRSRLEARWAVFFNLLEIKWFYEYEGYQLEAGWYLPDFWLPNQQMFMEIKPNAPTALELTLCMQLCMMTQKEVYLHPGAIENPYARQFNEDAVKFYTNGCDDRPYFWCRCAKCGKLGVEFMGCYERLCDCVRGDKGFSGNDFILTNAFDTAAKFRFDY